MWLKIVICWEVSLCLMKLFHCCWRHHCLFLHGITFLALIYPFDVWILIGPAQFFFLLPTSNSFHLPNFIRSFLSKWHIHSSQLLLHPPELGSVILNTQAVHFSDTSAQTFTRLCETKKWPPWILWSCEH